MIDEAIIAWLRDMLIEHEPEDQIEGRLAIIAQYQYWEKARQHPKSRRHAETLAHTWSNAVLLLLLDYFEEPTCKAEWLEVARAVKDNGVV